MLTGQFCFEYSERIPPAAYERCRAALREQLGAAPSVATHATDEQLLGAFQPSTGLSR